MMKLLKNPLLILIFFGLVLSACKKQVGDEVPVETEVVEAPELLDLLPAEATLIASYQIDAFQDLRRNSPLPTAMIDFLIPQIAALPDLLGDERLEGLDEEGAIYLALSREGFADALAGLKRGSPELLRDFGEAIPGELHLRIIVPAVDAELLAEGMARSCEAQRDYSCDAQVRGDFAVLDLALTGKTPSEFGQSSMRSPGGMKLPVLFAGAAMRPQSWDKDRPVAQGLRVEQTAAWKAFAEGGAPLALYGSMEGVFDQFAIFDLFLHALEEQGRSSEVKMGMRSMKLAELFLAYAYDDPSVVEAHDVVLSVNRGGDALFVDALASLTEYGQELVSGLARGANLRQRTLGNPVLDLRFGLDLMEAIELSKRPLWGSEIEDITGERKNMWKLFSSTRSWGMPIATLFSPITGYALYDEFVGPETTPAEFAKIRGFWLQVYGMEDADFSASPSVASSLGLQLPVGAPVESFEEFAQAALLPFGSPVTTQSVERGQSLEFQAASHQPVEELFSGEEEIRVESGLDLVADFKGIAALLNAPRVQRHVEPSSLFLINFLANLGTSKLFAHAGFEEGQGVARLQLGGDELIRPAGVEGGAAVSAKEAKSFCVHQGRIWSFFAFADIGMSGNFIGPGDENEGIPAQEVNAMAELLKELAESCESEAEAAEVRRLAGEWEGLRD